MWARGGNIEYEEVTDHEPDLVIDGVVNGDGQEQVAAISWLLLVFLADNKAQTNEVLAVLKRSADALALLMKDLRLDTAARWLPSMVR